MAQVSIHINGRPYSIACEDGQESRLTDLAAGLDSEVRSLASTVGQVGDSRLLVICGLSLIDRINDLQSAAATLPAEKQASFSQDRLLLESAELRAARAENQVRTLEQQLSIALARVQEIADSALPNRLL
jgi:cell division protein ZapA